MNHIFRLIFAATVTFMSTAAVAQKSTQELLREIESSNRATQFEMEQSRMRWQLMEAETARHHAEAERLRIENKAQEAVADRAQEIAERAEWAAFEQKEAARKAKEAAEELRDEMEQSAVRTKNNIYFGILFVFVAGSTTYIIRKFKKGSLMQENQKFGISTIIGSGLVILLAIVISDNWVYRFDFLQNLMSSLRIKLLADESIYDTYYIDIPTKYVVLTCICAAAYGLTTYLGITPVPRQKPQQAQDASDETAQ